mgnify:CR=1 FL=1|tara:strand:- start:897 stop:1286 length:390 start_codon:yes stop_codon:yes gene_type:complete
MNPFALSTAILTITLVLVFIYFNWKINQIKSRMRKQININVVTLVAELKENKSILQADENDTESKSKLSTIVSAALDLGEDSGTCEQSVEDLCEVAWNTVTYEKNNQVEPYASSALCNRDKKASRCNVF